LGVRVDKIGRYDLRPHSIPSDIRELTVRDELFKDLFFFGNVLSSFV
jgi:hypothetical protein